MDSALVGIVAYEPSQPLVALCRQLVEAGLEVVIVDNASGPVAQSVLAQAASAGARIMPLTQNLGVSGGLAALLKEAAGHEWLFTFDQDSRVERELLDSLLASPARQWDDVALIAPVVVDDASGLVQQGDPAREAAYDVERTITSGSLCRVSALLEVGGFREDLFIDYVDFELCLRLRAAGCRIVVEPTASLRHSIGAGTTHGVGRVAVRTSNHGADRQYYKYRNFLLLLRSGLLGQQTRWVLRSALALAWGPVKVVLFEHDKVAKLTAIVHGIAHGLRGRGGPRR